MSETFAADAIVIGSGFGGAVAAARLAQAGLSVVVLERGRRWVPGEFPRQPRLEDGWLWHKDSGLYDIRWLDRMASVQAAGWGGGSLVYANVFARPFDNALDGRWPAHQRREVLDPYYDLAAHMLGVSPVGEDPRTGAPPPRTSLIEDLMQRFPERTIRPNLAVTFGDPDTWQPNRHGVRQRGCAFVGECVIGCNHGAKNSLDYNYLAAAEGAGAQAITDAEVHRIEPRDGGYAVMVSTPSDPDAPAREWTAPRVVLAAGTVATTELLLRSRDVHRTLPGLSQHLGQGFSGNGDFLTLAQLRPGKEDMTTGPTITTNTVLDVPEGRGSVWFQVQEGAVPPVVRHLFDALVPGQRARLWWRRRIRAADPRRSFAVLSMGKDSGNGTLQLDRKGQVMLSWRNRWQGLLYRSQLRVGPLLARLLKARLSQPLTWTLLRRTITVHPLGGVRHGMDADSGVVDEFGEVHGYPGLVVMDGSVLGAASGVNPSATILAVAERSIENLIRQAGQPNWRAPEWSAVTPARVPEDAAFTFAAELHAATKGNGVLFRERMMTTRRARRHTSMSLTAEIASMDRFLSEPEHTVAMRGLIDIDGITAQAELSGTLSLFPDGRDEAMSYDLRFDDANGRAWQLTGQKHVRSRNPLALLYGLTHLRTEISAADAAPGDAERMMLAIGTRDLVRLLASIRGQGFTRARRLYAAARFAWFFTRSALRRRPPAPHHN
ncbi:GMC oxidoreductase [Ruania zhangjianzhongii]|uniref:GMC oxidoreductase n=1 Tax=Ruania zhangjianzhongii TaxID=2603206 RepID=UPI0011CB0ABE|nr:GMC oxidoreductase [Ruania zhangjianzhongii]